MSNPEQLQATPGPWTIGERLAKARRGSIHGPFTQQELAERLALVRATVGRYENDMIPTGELKRAVVAWAMATGWSYEWILTGTGPWLRDGKDTASDVPVDASGCRLRPANVPASVRLLRPTG